MCVSLYKWRGCDLVYIGPKCLCNHRVLADMSCVMYCMIYENIDTNHVDFVVWICEGSNIEIRVVHVSQWLITMYQGYREQSCHVTQHQYPWWSELYCSLSSYIRHIASACMLHSVSIVSAVLCIQTKTLMIDMFIMASVHTCTLNKNAYWIDKW